MVDHVSRGRAGGCPVRWAGHGKVGRVPVWPVRPEMAGLRSSPGGLRSIDRWLNGMDGTRRLLIRAAMLLATVAAVAGCGSPSDGPVMSICGVNIGRAEDMAGSGPFYVDASTSAPSAPVVAAPGSSPVNLRVSPDCSTGAQVSVSNEAVITVESEIRATDRADEVVSVSPLAAGRSTVTMRRAGARPTKVIFVVRPAH